MNSTVMSVRLMILLVAAVVFSACNHTRVLQPTLANVTRGASQIDVYGSWVRKLDTLGRGRFVMQYKLQYARAGTTITVNKSTGAIVSGTLTPLQSARISTTFAVTNNKATLTNPSTTTNAQGIAQVSIGPVSGPGGAEILTITIDYPSSTGNPVFMNLQATDEFEVDVRATTTWE